MTTAPPTLLAQFLRVGPHAGSHRVAVRASVSVGVPLLVLWAIGRLDLSIYAAFGAFTSLYGRNHVHISRLRMQLTSRPTDVAVAAVVAGGSAALAVVVGALGSVWRARRWPTGGSSELRRVPLGAIAARHAVRCLVGCAVAGTLATASGIGHPYWAMVSAVVPLAHQDVRAQVVRGAHRIVGTAAGLALAAVLLSLDLGGLALVVAVIVLQAGAELWVGRNYAIALVAVTPLALLMVHLVAPIPTATLLLDRGVETAIGVVVGVAVGWLTRTPHRHVAAA